MTSRIRSLRAPLAALLAAIAFPLPVHAQAPAFPALGEDDPVAALSRYLRMLAANPRDLASLTGAGRAALAVGDANAALGFYARAEEIAPRNGRIKAGLAAALVQMEQPRAALKLFDEAVALGVPVGDIASDRGLANDLNGEGRRAQADYTLALRAKDDDETVRRLALSMAISGDRAGALTMLDPLLRKRDSGAIRARAFVLALTGDQTGAANAVRAAMPGPQAGAMADFLARLSRLNPAQKALAVNFGYFPSDGRSYTAAELFADARAAPLPTAPGALAAARDTRRDTPLIPAGEPLGPRIAANGATTAAPRRRPGQIEAAIEVPPPPHVLAAPTAPVRTAAATPSRAPAIAAATPTPTPRPPLAVSRITPTAPPPVATNPAASAPAVTASTDAPARTAAATPAFAAAAPISDRPARTPAPAFSAPPPSAAADAGAALASAASAALPPAPPVVVPVATPPASLGAVGYPAVVVTAAGPALASSGGQAPAAAPAAVVAPSLASPFPQPAPTVIVAIDLPPSSPAEAAAPSAPPKPASATQLAALEKPAAIRLSTPPPTTQEKAKPVAKKAPVADPAKPVSDKSAKAAGQKAGAADAGDKPVDAKGKRDAKPDRKEKPKSKAEAARLAAADAVEKPGKGKTTDKTRTADKGKADKAKTDKDRADKDRADKAKPDTKAAAKGKTPERYWVQVASGSNKANLDKAWSNVKGKAPKLLDGKATYTAPWRASNRLLIGPFKTDEEAQAQVNKLAKAGVSGIQFTTRAGADVEKVTAR